MRTIRTLALVCVALLLIVSPTMAQDPVEINFYFPTAIEGPVAEKMQQYADQFMEMHPNIVVNPVYTGSYTQNRETILTEINSGELVVDVGVMLATDLYSFVEDGYVVPAQDFIDEMEDGEAFVEDFFPAMMLNGMDEEGTIWTVPFQRSTPLLYYNANLLEEAGLEAPTNNEELIEVAQALHTEDRAGFLLPVAGNFPIWLYQSFAAAYGQPLANADDPATVYFNTPETLAAVEFMTKLGMSAEDGGFGVGPMGGSAWGDTPAAFTSGAAAMIYHTSGSLASILQNADFEVGVGFLPSGPANEEGTGYAAPMGGGNLYIFDDGSKSEEELQAAWEWVMYLASPEIQADWSASNGYIAARQSAWELDPLKSLVEEFPQYGVARDQLEFAVKEFDAYRSIDIQNIVNSALSQIISGNVSLEEAPAILETAQQQIDSLLEEYQEEE